MLDNAISIENELNMFVDNYFSSEDYLELSDDEKKDIRILYVREARPQYSTGFIEYKLIVKEDTTSQFLHQGEYPYFKIIHNELTVKHFPTMFVANSFNTMWIDFALGDYVFEYESPKTYYMISFSKVELEKAWEKYFEYVINSFRLLQKGKRGL